MLIVFDLDDTLYLERDYVQSGFQAVGQWLKTSRGISGFASLAWQAFESGIRNDIFNRAFAQLGINDPHLLESTVLQYRQHQPSITLLPDAEALLIQCKNKNWATALITDGHPSSQEAKINVLRLTDHIEDIVVTGNWGKEWWKPHPRAFQAVQGKRTGTECIYLADNPDKDFQAPSRLGWKPSIRVRRPNSLHCSVPTPPECIEVCSMNGIEEYLIRQNG